MKSGVQLHRRIGYTVRPQEHYKLSRGLSWISLVTMPASDRRTDGHDYGWLLSTECCLALAKSQRYKNSFQAELAAEIDWVGPTVGGPLATRHHSVNLYK